MPPRKKSRIKERFDLEDLTATVSNLVLKHADEPNLLGYKPHVKQELFHKSTAKGRWFLGGNRCLASGTQILMADGSVKPIEDVVIGDYVIAGDGTRTRVAKTWYNGYQKVNTYTIGRYQDTVEVTCTPEHKFLSAFERHGSLTSFEKNPISELVNDRGRHKILRSQGTSYGTYEQNALWLGLMLGDGYWAVKRPSQMQFTCADRSLIEDFPYYKHFLHWDSGIQYYFKRPHAELLYRWFDSMGLIGTKSHDKFIPSVVWGWDEESIRQLCAGLIITDGSFYTTQDGEHHLGFTSVSFKLISEFRRLMGIRLGIWGSTVTENREEYNVTYGTREALSKIAELPILGKKKERTGEVPVRNSYSSHVGVKSCVSAGYRNTYDITVEAEGNSYVLANGLITSNSGKSVAGVVEDLWWVTKRHPHKLIPSHTQIRGRVVASDFTNGVETILFPIFKRWVLPSDLIGGSWEDSYVKDEKTLYFADGSFIEFRSCDQDLVKHAGTSRHFIHFDEEPPKLYFEENLTRIVDTNGYWWLTMTPVEGMTWVHSDLYAPDIVIPENLLYIIEVEMSDNIYLTKEGQSGVLRYFSEETKEARSKGKFAVKGGKVLDGYAAHTHHSLPVGWRPPDDWTIYTTQDHGFRNPAGVAWNAVDPSGKKVVTFHEIYEKGRVVEEIAAMMLDFEKNNGLEGRIYLRTGDPAMKQRSGITGTSVLFEYAMNGIIIGVEGVPKDESIGIDRMNMYLKINPRTKKPYWEITQECPKHNWEFKKLAWKSYASPKLTDRRNPVEQVQDKDNHLFDAQKYFFTFLQDLAVDLPPVEEEPAVGSLLGVAAEMSKPYDGPKPVSKWNIVETVPVQIEDFHNDYGWNYND